MWMPLLILFFGSNFSGTVLDEKSRPIVGAVVALIPANSRETPEIRSTDAMGRFEIPLSTRGPFRVEAYAPGYAQFRMRHIDPDKPIAIVLQRGGVTITGVVRDGSTLDPVQGAVVKTRAGEAGALVATTPRLGLVESISDDRGMFRLDGLAKGSYLVTASAPGYSRASRPNVAPGEPVEFYLFPGTGIYGRIVDEKGTPISGALVAAENQDRTRGNDTLTTTEESDSEGRFALLGLEPGRYRLLARHEEFAPVARELELSKESDTEAELVLAAGATVTGRLIDGNEQPVWGKVSLQALDGVPVQVLLRSNFTVKTDADGIFTLASLPPGDHRLLVEARGYGAKDVDAIVSGRATIEELGDIVLETGFAISGRVLTEPGDPIAAARVHVIPSFGASMRAVRDQMHEGETDEEGRFVIAGLPEGVYNILAEAPGFERSKPIVAQTGSSNVSIPLKAAGSIRGNVVNPEGHPVNSYRVMARSTDERGIGAMNVQEDDGAFVLDSIPEGEVAVEIVSSDFLKEIVSSVRVTAGNVSELGTIRLRRGARIAGKVVNTFDEPVPGATVVAVLPGQRRYNIRDHAATSDRLGRFEIGGLKDGRVEVAASHPGYADAPPLSVDVGSTTGPSEIQIMLRRGGAVEGYVRSRDGADIAGRTVDVVSREPVLTLREGSASAQTTADGYFHVGNIYPGNAIAELVQVEPTTRYAVQSREVEIIEGKTAYVEFQSQRVLVQGQVRRGGAPVSGAGIELMPSRAGLHSSVVFAGQRTLSSSGPRYLMAIASEDGYYELLVDDPGDYSVSVSARGVALPKKTVTIPDTETYLLDLDFGGALVSGRVVDKETEAPVAGAFVSAISKGPSSGGSSTGLQVGLDGVFELELEPGEFTLAVRAEGYATAEETVSIGQGGRADIVVAVTRGFSIQGRVVDTNQRALGNLRVMAIEDTPDIAAPPTRIGVAMTIPDGGFALDDLAKGRYNLLASGGLTGFAFLPSVPSGTTNLELVLRPGRRLEVRVVDPEGSPVANAIVAIVAIDGHKVRGVQGVADSTGRLVLSAPRGNLTMKAGIINGPEGIGTIPVTDSGIARIEITVTHTADKFKPE